MSNTSVTAFLQTEEFESAAGVSGNSSACDFTADSDGRVARSFGGGYTVDEVRALLRDLEHVQAAYESWVKRQGLPVGFGRPDITRRGRS